MTRRRIPGFLLAAGALAAAAPAQDESEAAWREAARVLPAPRALGVGDLVPDLELRGLDGSAWSLSALDAKAVVIAMRESSCPIAKRYGPRLARLEADYAARGVRFVFLNASANDDPAAMRADAGRFGLAGRYVADAGGALASRLGATSTTEVFVLDAARTMRYRGAVDEQYGLGFSRPEPGRAFLADALDAVLAGREPAVAATSAPGCALELRPAAVPPPAPTWHGRVSRIVQARCQDCHRDGAVGPFPLDSYRAAAGRKAMLRRVIASDAMPPFAPGLAGGPWREDRSLTPAEKADLLAWIDADVPEGDPADAPLPREFPSSWTLGEPDAVFELPREVAVPAEGTLDYEYMWVPTGFTEDKWVEAVAFRTTAPQVVHHGLLFLEEPRQPGESRQEYDRRFQGGLYGYFAGLVPGQGATQWPAGSAKRIPAGSWLKFQMHYTPDGVATTDRTQVAFRFAAAPPEHEIRTAAVFNVEFSIPAGAESHQVVAEGRFGAPAWLLGFSPHMHLRGRSFRYELVHADDSRELLFDLPRYRFDWQTFYRRFEPVRVETGDRIVCTAVFDNSAANPVNPDPARNVEFGEQTWDEMMIGYFEFWRDPEPPAATETRAPGAPEDADEE
ncbi:MAG TPA: redoxin family protein [Planctomycetota bacterium]